MSLIDDHPLRSMLADELHARPSPVLAVPCQAAYLALKQLVDAANRDRAQEHVHLTALLAPHGTPPPPADATHFEGRIGQSELKWESHTEFETFSVFANDATLPPFTADASAFPAAWLAAAPGKRIAAVMVQVEPLPEDPATIAARLEAWFVSESLACSWVLEESAIIAGDFRLDAAGQMRFAVFVRPGISGRRVGRIVQRLCEVETYRAMSMLGLGRARDLSRRLNKLDSQLSGLVAAMQDDLHPAENTLHGLLGIASELETLAVQNSFRFGATGAYEAIVNQRVEMLRESRFEGRQTLGEFMLRRYDPAMRTVKSAERRLDQMAARAERAGELLRTRVDVERSGQNQKLLASMDRRADLALRLQHTVEGLSVVAVSYYAVGLAAYLLAPLAGFLHWSKPVMTAVLVPVLMLAVWLVIRRVRRRVE